MRHVTQVWRMAHEKKTNKVGLSQIIQLIARKGIFTCVQLASVRITLMFEKRTAVVLEVKEYVPYIRLKHHLAPAESQDL